MTDEKERKCEVSGVATLDGATAYQLCPFVAQILYEYGVRPRAALPQSDLQTKLLSFRPGDRQWAPHKKSAVTPICSIWWLTHELWQKNTFFPAKICDLLTSLGCGRDTWRSKAVFGSIESQSSCQICTRRSAWHYVNSGNSAAASRHFFSSQFTMSSSLSTRRLIIIDGLFYWTFQCVTVADTLRFQLLYS